MEELVLKWLSDIGGVVGPLCLAALWFVWREWRRESQEKDALYAKYLESQNQLVGDYQRLSALILERLVQYDGERGN